MEYLLLVYKKRCKREFFLMSFLKLIRKTLVKISLQKKVGLVLKIVFVVKVGEGNQGKEFEGFEEVGLLFGIISIVVLLGTFVILIIESMVDVLQEGIVVVEVLMEQGVEVE